MHMVCIVYLLFPELITKTAEEAVGGLSLAGQNLRWKFCIVMILRPDTNTNK